MSIHKAKSTKLWNEDFVMMIVLGTLSATSFYMITPILTKYATILGATLTVAGMIAGLFSITALVARPFGGFISDTYNKKYILMAATLVMGISTLGYSLSTQLSMIVFFRILHGIGFAVNGTVTVALIASSVPPDKLGQGIGYYGITNILATAVGPNIGLLLGEHYGYKKVFLLSGSLLLITTVLMTRLTYIKEVKTSAKKEVHFGDFVCLKVVPLALIGGVFSWNNGVVSSFLVLLAEERNIVNITLYFTINALCMLLTRPIIGKIIDKSELSHIFYPAALCSMCSMLFLSRASALWMVLVAAVLMAFGLGAGYPAIQTSCIRKVDKSKVGVAVSTFYIGADIGQGIGPIAAGSISTAYGYTTMFTVCAGIVALGGIVFFAIQLYEHKHP